MPKLNKLLPEEANTVSRETLLIVADLIAWINDNNYDVLKLAIQKNGDKKARNALNELEKHCELWR